MITKDILISAAKACGYKLDHYYDPLKSDLPGIILSNGQLGVGCSNHWQPHKDDAQCLQLARKLGITLDYSCDQCAYVRLKDFTLIQEYWSGIGDDVWKTDREAVVAVAAQIGEKL